ncbi:hypothetical protein GCM10022228_15670 [Halomonas cibimaris]|uniref:Prepilin-type N-terminal cleavage/methylation domain-containing protein n=1 Tax=Halomonas cibimaris TaxID=657012 RepID=A0ABP7LUI1_9GAMM
MMPASRQAGFTLVELMVALLIGSLVVLGAGSLFLTTLQTFNKVDELSRKQEAVIFAAHTLSESIRSGDGEYKLKCQINKDKDDQCECTLSDDARQGQPLLTFQRPLKSAELSPESCALENPPDFSQNVVRISLPLEKGGKAIKFRVAKRQPVLNAYLDDDGDGKSPDPDNEGFYKDGTRMYNDRCYNGSGKFKPNRGGCDAP